MFLGRCLRPERAGWALQHIGNDAAVAIRGVGWANSMNRAAQLTASCVSWGGRFGRGPPLEPFSFSRALSRASPALPLHDMSSRSRNGAPLMLQSSAHSDSLAARWENDAVDSLPYVDGDLPDGWRDTANRLVAEEVRHPCIQSLYSMSRDTPLFAIIRDEIRLLSRAGLRAEGIRVRGSRK